ncbi:MAG TPA: DUF2530 domain-containing protein [Micromonosporaceae bacterium]|nr:DUF2530 domain-containing protein [Micromonosporaceae bacterium]
MPDGPTPEKPAQRELPPLDPPTVPFAIGGMALWAAAGLAMLPFRDKLADHGHSDWLWICVAGFLLGFPGWYVMIRHDRHRRARRARRAQEAAGTRDE